MSNPPEISDVSDVSAVRLTEIEQFFISYNRAQDREFRPLGVKGPRTAAKVLAAGQERHIKESGGKGGRR